MGFADLWNRTLVYFGIAEDEEWDEDGYVTNEKLERTYRERPNVRRLSERRRRVDYDNWADSTSRAASPTRSRAGCSGWRTRCSCWPLRTSRFPRRNAPACWKAAASSTRL